MDFIDHIQALAARVSKQVDRLATEEATKNALVMPFINALGYNVFDPTEVTPELTADVGVKKGEKVDYAILKDGEVIMLFECKAVNTNLDRVTPSQLYRYFSVTQARLGVLTNGVTYRFFSDLEAPNKMDTKPFLEFNILDIQESVIPEIKKLTKSHFNQEAILEAAAELKYTREMRRLLADQLNAPSDEFVRLFISEVYTGRVTQSVKDQFKPLVQRAFKLFVNEQINDRLKSVLASTGEAADEMATAEPAPDEGSGAEIETSEEEREAFHIVKAILRSSVEAKRISARDVKSYFGILLDNNNRKPLCRLYFNTSQKYVGLFDKGKQNEERVPIGTLDEIYDLGERLRDTLGKYVVEETGESPH
jgi:predicted type IV restriction endonuclease